MNKRDLVSRIRSEHRLSWNEAEGVLDTVLESIRRELRQGGEVTLRNFGTFGMQHFAPMTYKDVRSGKVRRKPTRSIVQFNPSINILKR